MEHLSHPSHTHFTSVLDRGPSKLKPSLNLLLGAP
jgi:hypothetical protein